MEKLMKGSVYSDSIHIKSFKIMYILVWTFRRISDLHTWYVHITLRTRTLYPHIYQNPELLLHKYLIINY